MKVQETAKTSLLLVDDSESLTRILSLVLSRKGYKISTARDGVEAVRMVSESPFDLVLMDIRMPRMNGLEAYLKIQEVRPGTPVLLMTAYAVDDIVQGALAEGAYAILNKPIDLDQTIGLLERAKRERARFLILVVDDHPALCTMLRQILEKRRCEVLVVHNGEDAIEESKRQSFDLILLDMKLPTMDGLDTFHGIRRLHPDSTIVFMTGYPEEMAERIREGVGSHAHACLHKPLDVEKLVDLLEELRERRVARNGLRD